MLIRLLCAQVVGRRRYEAGAVVEVSAELGAALGARGLAVPARPGVETTTVRSPEQAIIRKENKGG